MGQGEPLTRGDERGRWRLGTPAAGRSIGLAGAVLLAVAAYTVGAVPGGVPYGRLPSAQLLAQPRYSIGMACWVLGLAGLLAGWLVLRRPARDGLLRARWVVVTTLLWAVPLLIAPPLASRDVYAYAAQGELYAHGLDPYHSGPAALPSHWLADMSPSWRDSPAPYGPLALLIARLAAVVAAGHLTVALAVLRIAALAGVLLLAGYLPRLARLAGVDAGAACWLGLASPLVAIHLVSGAHSDALMLGLLVAGLTLAAQRRFAGRVAGSRIPAPALTAATALLAGAALGLAAAVKVTALLAVPFAVLLILPVLSGRCRLVRAAVAVVAGVAVAFGAASAAAGLGFGWASAAFGAEASVQWTSLSTGVGTALGFPLRLLGLPGAGGVLAVARDLALFVVLPAVLVALWWPVRRGAEPRAVLVRTGWAFAALLAASPAVHPWYVLWPVVILAAAATDRRVVTGMVAVTVLMTVLVLPDGYNLARVTGWVGAPLDLAIVLGLGWLAVRRLRRVTAV
ncbi:polyprenol phosphomannose-dependent alpha 1,6 mannosyltransferase MptB [Actinocatenispora thailandica]|uniref:polyprenol phosphomannose-dependent alpha 1,6 mannosyltransferase MptB n=1 Tax=Actinocatenispora thailandica TaxID=227318 RepID=UPI0019500B38|nr:polyprenol phosphomannose-dependent alpha 1,6 mannosyltransferase MptB [Actinocatenispora thailandica]